jgi:D-arabinose 5-phosphate isomerase GutQ
MFLSPGDAVHGSLGAVQPGDVVILISKGGGTAEITNLIPSIKAKRAFLVGVTENADSALGRACDLLLKIKIEKEADEFNMLATTSTMAVIVVFDAICVSLMEYTGYTREQFAIIHPSGAVGERLLAKKE